MAEWRKLQMAFADYHDTIAHCPEVENFVLFFPPFFCTA